MYLFYSLLYCIILFFLFPFQYLKRPRELRGKWLREKFGLLDSSLITHHSSLIWVHAVSVGEVLATLPLIKGLRGSYPSKTILLSTITDTGQKIAMERAPEGIRVVYLPFDIPLILKSVFKTVKPQILITIETELWPNIFRVFKKNRASVMVLNGRISENSFRGYRRISFFMKKVLSHVDVFCMQSEIDAERIKNLGVDEEKIKVLGNFKFDTKPPSGIPDWAKIVKKPIIVAGSTHEGEEELVTFVYNELKKDFPDLNVIIAPRHPERFKDVEDMLSSKGFSFVNRSSLSTQSSETITLRGKIILLDTVGELSAIYGIADIAIIGKSFRGYGGQNPLEAAYWGKPIVFGPHMENFPFSKDFQREGAAIQVQEESLYSELRELLLFPEKAKEIGSKALKIYSKNTGAVKRTIEVINWYLRN